MRLHGGARSRLIMTAAATIATIVAMTPTSSATLLAQVSSQPGAVLTPPAAANGKIAFVHRHQIFTIDSDGSNQISLIGKGKSFGPVWSPDGTRIAYVHQAKSAGPDLWIMNADGTHKTQVTSGGGALTSAASWSPDGSKLAFGGPCVAAADDETSCAGYEGYTLLDIVRTTAPFGVPVTLQAQSPSQGPVFVLDRVSWSPTGDVIAYHSNSYPGPYDDYILTYTFSDGFERIIDATGLGGFEGRIGNPIFGPGGDLLAWDAQTDAQGYIVHRGIVMCDYPIANCDQFKEVADDSQLAFAPAQDKVVVVQQRIGDRLYLADLDGRHRSRLTNGTSPSWQPVPIT